MKNSGVPGNSNSLQDYYAEQQAKLNDQRKKITDTATKAVNDPQGSVAKARRKTQIQKEINQINDWLAQYTDTSRYQTDIDARVAKKTQLEKELSDLTSKTTNQPSDSSKNLSAQIKNLYKLEQDQKSEVIKRLVIRAEVDRNTIPAGTPQFPDARQALLNVFTGMNTILKNGNGNLTLSIFYENNLRWLKLFKKYKLIEDDRSPCLIIGDRQMILDLLYRNNILNLASPSVPVNNLSETSDFYLALNSQEYYADILNLVSRKKYSSSFSESLYIDELSFKDKDRLQQLTETERTAKTFDIPIFVNNFRNANVLSYSLKNTENYISVISPVVRENRLKILYPKLKENAASLYQKFFTKNTNNPIEIANEYFNNGINALPEEIKKIKLTRLSNEDITKLDEFKKEKSYEKWDVIPPQLKSALLSIFPIGLIGGSPNGGVALPGLEGLSFSQNSENVSYLNLSIQNLLRKDNLVKEEDLAAVSELIILLNDSAQTNDLGGVNIVPGLRMPGMNSILSRVHEYSKRNSIELSIKTLPFFHLSDMRTLNTLAIFYSKRIISTGTELTEALDFFSGNYTIVGFRHVITTSECYSEFMLSKFGASDDLILKS
jgi:hypothetical protein